MNDDFYLKKLRFTPSDEAPLVGFKWVLEKLNQSGTLEDNVVKAILLDTHYKYDRVKNMASLLDIIDKKSCTLLLMDVTTRTVIVVHTIHNTIDVPTIWIAFNGSPFFKGF